MHLLHDLWHGVHRSLLPKYPNWQTQSVPSYLVLGSHVLHTPPILKKPVEHTHFPLFHTEFYPHGLQTPSMMFSFLSLQTQDDVCWLNVDLSGQTDGWLHWLLAQNLPPLHTQAPVASGVASAGQFDTHADPYFLYPAKQIQSVSSALGAENAGHTSHVFLAGT